MDLWILEFLGGINCLLSAIILFLIKQVWSQSHTSEEMRIKLLKDRDSIIPNYLSAAKREVWILTTSLDSIKKYLPELKDKVENGNGHFKVRILTLNPNHSFTSDRCHDFNFSPDDFKQEMIRAIEDCFQAITDSTNPNKVELRVHTRFPTGMMFLIDNNLVLGHILHENKKSYYARGRRKPHIVFHSRHPVAESFRLHFEVLWDHESVTVSKNVIKRIKENPLDVNRAFKSLRGDIEREGSAQEKDVVAPKHVLPGSIAEGNG